MLLLALMGFSAQNIKIDFSSQSLISPADPHLSLPPEPTKITQQIHPIQDQLTPLIKQNAFVVFGAITVMLLVLRRVFRNIFWVFLPLITGFFSVIYTAGFFGALGWDISIAALNFIPIQLVITFAVSIHLIARFLELGRDNTKTPVEQLVLETILTMAQPCFFTILTTTLGFGSLILVGNLPIAHTAWMMTLGMGISLVLAFVIFSVGTVLFNPLPVPRLLDFSIIQKFARFSGQSGFPLVVISLMVMIFAIVGVIQLQVDPSFISFFKTSGIPLEVRITLSDPNIQKSESGYEALDEEDLLDLKDLEAPLDLKIDSNLYWYTANKMKRIEAIHDFIESRPNIESVTSLATLLKLGKRFNEGKAFDTFILALIFKELPQRIKDFVITPYVAVETNQIYFVVRVRDSVAEVSPTQWQSVIQQDIQNKLDLSESERQSLEVALLYQEMGKDLFHTQMTLLLTMAAVFLLVVWVLFGSFKMSLIALFPILLSVFWAIGLMGWLGIQLDLVTLIFGMISLGIAVDNSIHYLYRFKKEFKGAHNDQEAMLRCHRSVAPASYITSIMLTLGFLVLVFSEFTPSRAFGLLISFAVIIPTAATLTLLPFLIVKTKPFG